MKKCARCNLSWEDRFVHCGACGEYLGAAPPPVSSMGFCIPCNRPWPAPSSFCGTCGAHLQRVVGVEPVSTPQAMFNDYLAHREILKARVEAFEWAQLERVMEERDPERCGCHYCGTYGRMRIFHFSFCKPVKTKRLWGDTLASVAASAIGIGMVALVGFGGVSFQGPGKQTTYRVIPAQLLICATCEGRVRWRQEHKEGNDHIYGAHPWTEGMKAIGFTVIMSKQETDAMQPVKIGPEPR